VTSDTAPLPIAPRVLAALVVVAFGVLDATAEDAAPNGAWRIEPQAVADSTQPDFLLVTSATGDADATFGLWCRRDLSIYAFVMRDARLARLAAAEETPMALRPGDDEPARFAATSLGDGRVILQEKVHQTAFAAILASLKQTAAASLEVSIDDRRWVFPLDGFVGEIPALAARCDFAPGEAQMRDGLPSRPGR
jgi:hypothetical protein